MARSEAVPKRKSIFYGWWIVVDATLAMALNGGIYFYGFSAFYNPLLREFGWSSTALSGAFSLSRLEGGLAAPLVGFMADRFGPRLLMIFGFSTVGIGFILLSQVNSIAMFYFVFVVLISGGSSFGFFYPCAATVANWFIRKRSLALGIMSCGTGIGGIAIPGLAWLITQFGWRTATVVVGILFLVSAVPLSLLMRHRPEAYGCLPDGDEPGQNVAITANQPKAADDKQPAQQGDGKGAYTGELSGEFSFSPRQAIGTSTFWILCFAFAFRQIVTSGVAVHEIPALENLGFSPEVAAGILAAMTIVSIPGRLGFGWLADRYDKRHVIALGLVLHCLGLVAFAFATDFSLVLVFLLVYSPAYGGLIPLMPATYSAYFGRRSFATVLGLSQIVTMWGTILGPIIAGYTFDMSGSYQIAFLFFAAMSLVGMFLLLFVRMPKAQQAYQAIAK